MKLLIVLATAALALAATGCGPRRTVVVVQQPAAPPPSTNSAPVADDGPPHDEASGDAWDGERWVVIRGHVHGPGCGHYHHHGVWHVHPAAHVYVGGRGHHWGVGVRVR